MSAEALRKAAALMRERAEVATASPWELDDGLIFHPSDGSDTGEVLYVSECYGDANGMADATHIVSWHPAVALAVADWLDATAAENDSPDESALGFLNFVGADALAALAVARAYLGSDQ